MIEPDISTSLFVRIRNSFCLGRYFLMMLLASSFPQCFRLQPLLCRLIALELAMQIADILHLPAELVVPFKFQLLPEYITDPLMRIRITGNYDMADAECHCFF